ncbi:MAG: glycosyltransferase family 2 protein [Propioniciclava sp.]
MDVSVVIPHYGDPTPTQELVAALLPQVAGIGEIIVADDHSPAPFPQIDGVTVVRREANGGFGANCNTGATRAEGDHLLFLNSDVTIGPTFLADLLTAAQPYQPCMAGPRILGHDGAVTPTARLFPTVSHQTAAWLTPLARWRATDGWHRAVGHDMAAVNAASVAVTDWLVGAALLIPRPAFEAVTGFDEDFFMNSEEIDLQRRLHEQGLPAILIPSVVIQHVGGGSSDSAHRRGWLTEAQLHYAEKWGGATRLRAALFGATVTNLIWNTGRRALGREVHPLRTARDEFALIRGRRGTLSR